MKWLARGAWFLVLGCAQSHSAGPAGDGDIDDEDRLGPCRGGDGVWRSEAVDPSLDATGGSSIAVGDDGVAHVQYYGPLGVVVASRQGGEWHAESIEGSVGWYDLSPLAVDAQGSSHLAAALGSSVVYATNASGGWTTEVVAEGFAASGQATLSLDAAGAPIVAYVTDEGLWVASREPSGWCARLVDASAWTNFLGLASFDGKVVVGAVTGRWELVVWTEGEAGWTSMTVDDGPVYGRPKIDGTADGALRLAYHMDAPRELRRAVVREDGSIEVARTPAPDGLEDVVDFAYEDDGTLHVGGFTADAVLHAEYRGTWATEVAAPLSGGGMDGVLVALGKSPDSVHFLYQEFASSDGFSYVPVPRYAFAVSACDDEGWDGVVPPDGHEPPRAVPCPAIEPARLDEGVNPDVARSGRSAFVLTWGQIDWTRASRRSLFAEASVDQASCQADSLGDGDPPSLAANDAGDVVAVWGNDFGPERAWARRRYADGSWGAPQVLPSPAEGNLLQAALDGAGAISVTGVTLDQRVWAAHADVEDDWTVSTLHAAPSPAWTGMPAVGAGEDGAAVVGWVEAANDPNGWSESLWSSIWTAEGWAEPLAVTEDTFNSLEGATHLEVRGADDAIYGWVSDGPSGYGPYVAQMDGERTWSRGPELGASNAGPLSMLDMASSGDAIFVWDGGFSVRAATRDSTGQWSPPETIGDSLVWGLDAAVSSVGEAIAVWSSPDGDLASFVWASRFRAGRWSEATRVSTTEGVFADAPRVALAEDGTAMVAWHEIENPREYPMIVAVWAATLPP